MGPASVNVLTVLRSVGQEQVRCSKQKPQHPIAYEKVADRPKPSKPMRLPRIELEEQSRARDVAELRMLIEQSVRGRRWAAGELLIGRAPEPQGVARSMFLFGLPMRVTSWSSSGRRNVATCTNTKYRTPPLGLCAWFCMFGHRTKAHAPHGTTPASAPEELHNRKTPKQERNPSRPANIVPNLQPYEVRYQACFALQLLIGTAGRQARSVGKQDCGLVFGSSFPAD